jgi:hypothetical protein
MNRTDLLRIEKKPGKNGKNEKNRSAAKNFRARPDL